MTGGASSGFHDQPRTGGGVRIAVASAGEATWGGLGEIAGGLHRGASIKALGQRTAAVGEFDDQGAGSASIAGVADHGEVDGVGMTLVKCRYSKVAVFPR